MVDQLTDIPLAGRRLAPPYAGGASGGRQSVVPAFVAGPENRLIAAAFRRLLALTPTSAGAAQGAPSVLALFGSSGTGKTHLVHGVVRHWKGQHGDETALYVTTSDFRRRYVEAVGGDEMPEFRRRFRGCRLLAIDDLHQLPAHEHLSQELRYTLDEYEEQGGTVIVTADRPMTALANLPADVRSRLGGGLMLQLAEPGAAARLRIVRQYCDSLGHSLTDEAAKQIADGVGGSTTRLIGALARLWSTPAGAGAKNGQPADHVLAARQPSLREIIAVVARYTNFPQKQLRSGSRKQSIVFARAIVVYLARELAGASYHEIGRALGGRDHTTIMHNYRKIDDERRTFPPTQETLDELRRILTSR